MKFFLLRFEVGSLFLFVIGFGVGSKAEQFPSENFFFQEIHCISEKLCYKNLGFGKSENYKSESKGF